MVKEYISILVTSSQEAIDHVVVGKGEGIQSVHSGGYIRLFLQIRLGVIS